MSHDVFISHSSSDKRAADAACAVLEARGIKCWIAPRDIRPGSDWGESIITAIEQTRVMLLLLSKQANSSPQIRREVERAVNRSIIIIPVRLEDVMPARSLEFFLSTSHWMDAFPPPFENHLENLSRTIHQIVFGSQVPFSHPKIPVTPWWQRHALTLLLAVSVVAITFAIILGLLLALVIPRNHQTTRLAQQSPLSQSTVVPQTSVIPHVQTITPALRTPTPTLSQPASDNDLPLLAGTWNQSFDDARATPLTELFGGTPVGNIAMAALTNSRSVHQLIITSTGMIEIREEPEDTGTYSFARGYLTLISNRSQRSDRYQYKLSVANAAIPLVMAGPGDGLLDLTGFSNYPTRWVRKGDSNPESLVGSWKTPLLTFVTGSQIVFLYTPGTFEFKADQTYVLHLTRTQTGTLKATNGIYTLTSGLLSAQGNYQFEGSDTFVDTQGKTTSIWKRQ
jgi:TIR domain